MDESIHHPRFRKVHRPRLRRTAKPRPHATSEAEAQRTLGPSVRPVEDALQDGDAEGGIHALLHQGMHLAEHDHSEEAMQVLTRAQALAEAHQLPALEAQALFNQGIVQAQQGKARAAIPLLKLALAQFGALDDPRMQASISLMLGQVLLDTGQPQHAVLVLRRALKEATTAGGAERIAAEEWEGLRFALLRGLGLAYQAGGQLDRALFTYQQALESDTEVVGNVDYASLFSPLLQLYADLGQVETALTVGQAWLEQLSPLDPEALQVFVELSFELGLLCSEWERHHDAVRTYKATYAAWHRLRTQVSEPDQTEEASAFIGKVLANIGMAYLHEQAFVRAVAYLRGGADLLEQAHDEESAIPKQNLALLEAAMQESGIFQQLWQASEPLYAQLKAGPATLPG